MATYESLQTISGDAGTAVTIYHLVTLATDGAYDHCGDPNEKPAGICGETVGTVGKVFPIVTPASGIVKVKAGAAVSVGDELQSDATGRVVTHVSAAGDYRVGTALTAAAAANDIIEMQFHVELDEVT